MTGFSCGCKNLKRFWENVSPVDDTFGIVEGDTDEVTVAVMSLDDGAEII